MTSMTEAARTPRPAMRDVAIGAGAGLVAGGAVAGLGFGLLRRHEFAATAALGFVAGGVGGAIAGAATTATNPVVGTSLALGVPALAVAAGMAAGPGHGMYALLAMMVGIPFALGGLAGVAASAATT